MKETQLILIINPEPELRADSDIAEAAQELGGNLWDLDVIDVSFPVEGEIPIGAKATDPVSWGTLVITLLASGGVLTTVINSIVGWLRRYEGRSVTLQLGENKLEVTGLSEHEQKELIQTWLSHNRGYILSNE